MYMDIKVSYIFILSEQIGICSWTICHVCHFTPDSQILIEVINAAVVFKTLAQ